MSAFFSSFSQIRNEITNSNYEMTLLYRFFLWTIKIFKELNGIINWMSDIVQKKIWAIQRNWLYNKMNHDYDYNPRNSLTNLLYDFNNETISTMTANFHL